MLLPILLSIGIVSGISAIGIVFFSKIIEKYLFVFVSFAIGALLGTTFFDLLEETDKMSLVLAGVLLSFVLEKILWHHHHHYDPSKHGKHIHPAAYLNVIGDSIHNFIDGMIIASAYITNFSLGLTVTLAIILHEIPQEIGDFCILLASGLSRGKALFFNFLSALTSFGGALLVYLFSFEAETLAPTLLAFAAGNFLYIATVDMIPELQKEKNLGKSLQQFFFIFLGLGLIWLSTQYGHA